MKFLSIKGGCTGSFESTLVKMPHCWKSHVTAQILFYFQEDMEVVMYDIIDEVTLGLCFDVHRSCKLGTLFLGDTDPK